MSNRYKMPIIDYMQFKKYISSKEAMRWAYLNYKNKITFQQMIREEKYLKEHHKLLIIKGDKLFGKSELKYKNAKREDFNLKRIKVKIKNQDFMQEKVFNQLVEKMPSWIKEKAFTICLHSAKGESANIALAYLVDILQKDLDKKVKVSIKSAPELVWDFKQFDDSDSLPSNIAKADILVIANINSIPASPFERGKITELLSEAYSKNTITLISSNVPYKDSGCPFILNLEIAEVDFEGQLLKDLGL